MALLFLSRFCCQIPLLPFSGGFAVPSLSLPKFNFIITSEIIQGWLTLDATPLRLTQQLFFTS